MLEVKKNQSNLNKSEFKLTERLKARSHLPHRAFVIIISGGCNDAGINHDNNLLLDITQAKDKRCCLATKLLTLVCCRNHVNSTKSTLLSTTLAKSQISRNTPNSADSQKFIPCTAIPMTMTT